MLATVETYPDFKQQVRNLVQQHVKSWKQRLLLAVYFAPVHRKKRDVFLFEVIDGFGGNAVEPKAELFEFTYGSTPALPLPPNSRLHVILSNPVELEEAARDKWKAIRELAIARRNGRAILLHANAAGKRLWGMIP